MMFICQQIHEYVEKLPEGQAFSAALLRHLGSADNVWQILSRLVKEGVIKRVARGIYVKPKYLSRVGEVMPSAQDIVQVIAETTGETIAIHGAEAVRQLHLSTQMPMKPIFYTTGTSRQLKIGNREIVLQHISPSKLVAPGTIAGTVITALWYMGKEQVSTETINAIKQRLSAKEFDSVLEKIHTMPTWMADIFYRERKRA